MTAAEFKQKSSRYHGKEISAVGTVRYPRLEPRDADCAAKLKKRTLTNLYNERPAWLDLAHKKLDAGLRLAGGFDGRTNPGTLARLEPGACRGGSEDGEG